MAAAHLVGMSRQNRHFVAARDLLAKIHPDRAQVEATLALAYEQRTANLIALANTVGPEVTARRDLQEEIARRLGVSPAESGEPKDDR